MKTRGLVLEVRKNSVLVVTRDGKFRCLPRQGIAEVGKEYCYKTPFPFSQLAVAAVILLAVASVFIPMQHQPVSVAYVSLDINPSIEMSLDSSQKVIGAEAYNIEGEQLLDEIKLVGQSLEQSLGLILEFAQEGNYFAGNEPLIIITGTPAKDGDEDHIPAIKDTASRATANFIKKLRISVSVSVISADRVLREEARKTGLSMGKYAVYLQARSEGYGIEVDSLQRMSVSSALLAVAANPVEILRHVEAEQNFADLVQVVRNMPLQEELNLHPEDKDEEVPVIIDSQKEPGKPDKKHDQPTTAAPSVNVNITNQQDKETNPEPSTAQEKDKDVDETVDKKDEKEEIPVIMPAETEPEFEEAKRGLWDWFRDFIWQDKNTQ